MSVPIYLALASPTLRDACASSLSDAVTLSLDDLPGDQDPGVVVVDPSEHAARELLDGLQRLDEAGGWRLAVVRAGDPIRLQSLSLGPPRELDDVAEGLGGKEEVPGTLLVLGGVLEEISRARHDINNPLTSALAEAQLLLMDVPEGEVREGLAVIQDQLRRIRDLVAATGHLRPPRR